MKGSNVVDKKEFQPYVPANKVMPEFTVVSILLGAILAVVFGGANAYLGLRVGMTVSASIPAAVISMGIIRKILRRDSILENNMVQTIGSAGESVAAGGYFHPVCPVHVGQGGPVRCAVSGGNRPDRAVRRRAGRADDGSPAQCADRQGARRAGLS